MSEKIGGRHLSRKALVYVRQSSAHQLLHNEESRRLQYAMQDRVRALGWSEIEVIDDDLGRTASGTIERSGFQKLVAAVCLGGVGVVAARELSRFARNSRDWQQLMEVCRLVDTLLIDHEAVYDTRSSNDRLLLGLKGSMNEYELELLRLRSVEARYEKASRGEYFTKLPAGFVNRDGRLELDPDARVQQAIKLVFEKALETGSARQVFEWLLESNLELPASAGGGTEWRSTSYSGVLRILKNPMYAGAYFYGRTAYATSIEGATLRRRRVRQSKEKWRVWIPGHHEAYVSWQDFERIQKMLSENEMRWGGQSGMPREGTAIAAGLLRCRRCGRKLTVAYSGPRNDYSRYSCRSDGGEPGCMTFGGRGVDRTVVAQILRVLRPAALEAAVEIAHESVAKKDNLVTALELERESALYAADRARRQYDAVDPANRLVADELERRWEAALRKVTEVDESLKLARSAQRTSPPPSLDGLRALAKDFDRVWDAQSTSFALKKRIVRALIEEIVVDVDPEASRIDLVFHWKGGRHSSASVPKLGTGKHVTDLPVDVIEVIRVLARVCSDRTIAAYLTRSGTKPATGNRWTWKKVAAARNHRGIPPASKQPPGVWLSLGAAAKISGIDRNLLSEAASRGLIDADHPLTNGPWVFAAETISKLDGGELRRQLRSRRSHDAQEDSLQLDLAIPTLSLKGAS
jgi:DNA invertase Pin-like site-specific DNA recombinase